MFSVASFAHFNLPRLPFSEPAQAALEIMGPDGLAWVEEMGRCVGLLNRTQAERWPEKLAQWVATPANSFKVLPLDAPIFRPLAQSKPGDQDFWRIYQGSELVAALLDSELSLLRQLPLEEARRALKTLPKEPKRSLAERPVAWLHRGESGRYWGNLRARQWLDWEAGFERMPQLYSASAWVLVIPQKHRHTALIWAASTEDRVTLPQEFLSFSESNFLNSKSSTLYFWRSP
ncbi:MAG: hypothetical protein RRB13_11305 [bacterium]|nr:hypothetical protein [bacterium]